MHTDVVKWSSLVLVVTYHLFDAKPLPQPVLNNIYYGTISWPTAASNL